VIHRGEHDGGDDRGGEGRSGEEVENEHGSSFVGLPKHQQVMEESGHYRQG
jgi:hypothetical protein